ncbi:hypothetical protein EDB86DRAFT_3087388 [Lactarius hatsudake]|nr:hypothetical protein EDB86DRAFT_3087388 [Lactarius hatsudake]
MNVSTVLIWLICIFIDDKLMIHHSQFNISVSPEETIGGAVDYVKVAMPSVRDKDNGAFNLYQPPLGCPIRITELLPRSQLTQKDLRTLLLIPFTVGEVFQEKGADCCFDIDVIVHVDSGEHGGGIILHTLQVGSSNSWLQYITFHLRTCNEAQLPPKTELDANKISEFSVDLDGALPDFIEQLERELCLRRSPGHNMTILPSLASVKAHLGDDTFGKYFPDVNDGSETHCITDIELLHYLNVLIDRHLSNQAVKEDFKETYPRYDSLDKKSVDRHDLSVKYDGKDIHWSKKQHLWVYKNNQRVVFLDTNEEDLTPAPSTNYTDLETEQAEVSGLLEKATKTVTATLACVSSRPQTPQSPSGAQLPSTLPSTPGPSTQPQYPLYTPTPKLFGRSRPPSPPTPSAPPVSTSSMASTGKSLGVPPDPFDGKQDKAEAFWQSIENYYYLNQAMYPDEGKRVSAALTHFKTGTSAGDWAQDKQKKALEATPIEFGT